MIRVKLIIQYDGANYNGWQRQKHEHNTIQEIIENAIYEALHERVTLEASGRTDAGVSAFAQVAHFDTVTRLPIDRLPYMLKFRLPSDISVLSAVVIPNEFHSRFDAKRKTYLYRMYTSDLPLPLYKNRMHINHALDIEAMREACKEFVGVHDFTSFTRAESVKDDCKRTIFDCRLEVKDNFIDVFVTGSGFLHNMVRIIVGTLLAVGEGKIPPKQIQDILKAKDRTKAFMTLPPYYLYLCKVEY